MLAAQQLRGLAGEAAEHDVRGVDDVPLARNLARLGAVRTHRFTLSVVGVSGCGRLTLSTPAALETGPVGRAGAGRRADGTRNSPQRYPPRSGRVKVAPVKHQPSAVHGSADRL
ncbi:hypothetical protein Athai_53410 [Actinocatenispora thailandica]|uniref:Uncharacterized protein n=1 Tax=Actinocatenispora thailandica TaxID=227318 RepID=A0A7R7I0A8_9ACTN|nr:hypothetical protein Athai_53410 [Actinocatenispora thailandica]